MSKIENGEHIVSLSLTCDKCVNSFRYLNNWLIFSIIPLKVLTFWINLGNFLLLDLTAFDKLYKALYYSLSHLNYIYSTWSVPVTYFYMCGWMLLGGKFCIPELQWCSKRQGHAISHQKAKCLQCNAIKI